MQISSKWLGVAVVGAAVLGLAGACGDDSGGTTVSPAPDAGHDAEHDASDAAPDVEVEVGLDAKPIVAEFGLDTRPSNPTCLAPARPSVDTGIAFEPVFEEVSFSSALMAMAQPPGDDTRWFAALRNGVIVSFPSQGASGSPQIAADLPALSGLALQAAGEGGLLGIAFHPDFSTNGQLFVSWTITGGPTNMRSTIARLTSSDDGASFTAYEAVIPPFDQPATNHNGGALAFGPDGYLYIGFGDGGGGNDSYNHGQDPSSFFAKILRIDVDTTPSAGNTYVVPSDNPFASGGGEPATYAWGLRNPFRFSFDRDTGELWVGDVGQTTWEEIDRVELGGNYGWPCREGAHDHLTDPAKCPDPDAAFVDPVYDYEHDGSASVTGGVVYRGSEIPGAVGTYLFGDYATQQLFAMTFDPVSGDPVVRVVNPEGPFRPWGGFAQDNHGEVYALSLGPPGVFKLVAVGQGPAGPEFPALLSQTGCVDPADPTRPADGVLPFDVNAPLWSDGAGKERYMAIPDGATIGIGSDGDFSFPVGTVLIKTFSVAGKRVETRLFVRHDDGDWGGYTYEWNDQQTDAALLPSGKTKQVGGLTWTFPSRANCVQCHTEAAGRALGPEVGQLNRHMLYPSTNRIANQLRTLEHIGMFEAPLGAPVDELVAYPEPLGAAPVEDRARAYLHANCAHCHRENGPGRGPMDLRYSLTLAETSTCDATPEAGDLGIDGARIVAPGAPNRSLLLYRTRSTDVTRMAPLATDIVDEDGTAVIESWIAGLTACP